MSSTDDKLNEVLEIADLPEKVIKTTPKVPRPKENEDVDSDYKYSRENLYNLVERGQDAIDGILDLAREGEHPRAYEVAGQLIKNVGEVTEKLLQLQEKMKKLKDIPDKAPKNVTNALFVGSTTELNKLLKGKPIKDNE
jgi:hypothetical protein